MEELLKAYLLPLDPAQRIYWPFLISSMVFIAIFINKKKYSNIIELFKHPSAIFDYKIMLINLTLKATLFPLLLFSSFSVSVLILKGIRFIFPHFNGFHVSALVASLFATLFAFIIDDFFRFFHHFLMHKIAFLRKLHRVHHSALVLTPFTLFRAHPLESLIASFRNIISIGLTIAMMSFIFNGQISFFDILGVNVFGFVFNALLANLRHSPIPISFGFLEYIFISPRMHQIHHSTNQIHFDKNYGIALTIWDILFKSFYRPSNDEFENLNFGLYKKPNEENILEATSIKKALTTY